MSISERVEEIMAKKNGSAQSVRVLRDSEEMSSAEREALSLCVNAMKTFGVIESLGKLHRNILDGKGNLKEDSYVESDERSMAVSRTSLSWQDEDETDPKQIIIVIKKIVESNSPFELTIEASNNLRFITSIDSLETERLTRDDDIGRWDDIHDDNLGFFSSQVDLKEGIEVRLAIASAQLIAH